MTLSTLIKLAKADHQPALALTDRNNLFGALEFSEKAVDAGIQPIAGMVAALSREEWGIELETKFGGSHTSLVLLAASQEGLDNLMRLCSLCHIDSDPSTGPELSWSNLAENAQDLIVLTGGTEGPLDALLRKGRMDQASTALERLQALFDDRLYIELHRHGLSEQRPVEAQLRSWAYERGIPLVATNACYFAKQDDFEAHDALLAVAEGRAVRDDDRRQLTPEHRFKSQKEMQFLFADCPEAIEQTAEIAMRCHVRPLTRKPILPRFTRDADHTEALDEAKELRAQAWEGLEARLKTHGLAQGLERKTYEERLEFELSVIERMQYAGYFLIVSDFIKWAKTQSIPVGPGRGSGAGSLVAFALMITDLDPLRFGLLFERFLNPDRVSMPDFDIDFCQDRRDEVIAYVQRKYGSDRVAQIITFGTLQARGVLRDVGRVLEMPYGQVDRLCKLVPQNPANPVTLEQAIATEPRLKAEAESEDVVKRLLAIALKLEGLHRHASTHAAGIVIGDRPLKELVPLYRDPRSSMPVTQYNMKWVEAAGLVKFDFLGLKTLTVIREAIRLLALRGIEINIDTIPLDDAATYNLLSKAETAGVFQLESAGMRRALADMRPDRFEDIIALVALYRPGPMDNIPVYCARKHGNAQAEYDHPLLESVLKETFGVIIYQEQVMQIAQILAGYTLGEADLLRRAMGKKIKAEMAAQRERFVEGSVARGIPQTQADSIFDLLAKFADYGFNKSHAAAYALVAYQTAYLKANYPAEFLAATMTLDAGNTDKLAEFREEAKRLRLRLEPPNVNTSGAVFIPQGEKIHYALGALKGIGQASVEAIIKARAEQPFQSMTDFLTRLDLAAINKKTIETLAAAGGFDELEANRARIFSSADSLLRQAQADAEDKRAGQTGLFAMAQEKPLFYMPETPPWPPGRRLQEELQAIGFYLSGHPLDDYAPVLAALNIQTWQQFSAAVKRGATAGRCAGSVIDRVERRTKTGSKMGILTLSDASGQYEALLFSEMLQSYRDICVEGALLSLQLAATSEGDDVRARVQEIIPLATCAQRVLGHMVVTLNSLTALECLQKELKRGGEGKVSLRLQANNNLEAIVELSDRYVLTPDAAAMLRILPGVVDVTFTQEKQLAA